MEPSEDGGPASSTVSIPKFIVSITAHRTRGEEQAQKIEFDFLSTPCHQLFL
jgi:hypothetical protein